MIPMPYEKTGKSTRKVPKSAAKDVDMKRFRDNVDPELLDAFLAQDKKYEGLLATLHDPAYDRYSFAAVCRLHNVSLADMQAVYTDGMRHLALLEMSNGLPKVA